MSRGPGSTHPASGHGPESPAGEGRRNLRGAWGFAGGSILAAAGLWCVSPETGERAFGTFIRLAVRVAPVLAVVFALFFLFNLWISPGRVKQWLGRGSGVRGWVTAVAGGVFSMGPIFAWYPLLAELRRHGMRPALVAAFLYARAIKLQLMPMFAYYFGLPYLAILTFYMGIFSLVAGWLTERFAGRNAGTGVEKPARPE